MSEGTKIDSVNSEEKNLDESQFSTESDSEDLKGTKIGEVSDFEKELIGETNQDLASTETFNESVVSEPVETHDSEISLDDKASPQSEMERFLEEESSRSFEYEIGDIVPGTIRSIEKSGILIDFKFKSDGYMSSSEIGAEEDGSQEKIEEGKEYMFLIEKLETREGYAILSRRKAQQEELWERLLNISKERETVQVDVSSKVQGGLVASFNGIKGFIPASQIIRENQDGMEQFVGAKMEVSVLQVDQRRKKVIFSNKAAKYNLRREGGKLLNELEVGQVREGKVTSLKDFGVFVDLGGVEGLIHISELSWSRVHHPSDFVKLGESIKVFILGVDKENRRISLGMKQLEADPWVEVNQKYKIGDFVQGEVTRTASFGAFVKLEDKLEGLIHISELSNNHVEKVSDVLKEGDSIKAKIIKLQIEEQKIGLSLKQDDDHVESSVESAETAEEPIVSETPVNESSPESTEEAVAES